MSDDPLRWRTVVRDWDRLVPAAFDRVLRNVDIHPVLNQGDPTTMHTGTTRQLTNLLDQQRRLEERIAQLTEQVATYGTEDPYEVGSILVWDKTFRPGNRRTYSYAALKTPVGWYVTGRQATVGMGWFELIDFIVEDALHLPVLYCVTELTEHEAVG